MSLKSVPAPKLTLNEIINDLNGNELNDLEKLIGLLGEEDQKDIRSKLDLKTVREMERATQLYDNLVAPEVVKDDAHTAKIDQLQKSLDQLN